MVNSYSKKSILERDKKQCFLCKSKKQLEVHHIIEQYNKGTEDYFNLITLCRKCHILDGNHNKLIKHRKQFIKYVMQFKIPDNWENIANGDKDAMTKIGITVKTKERIIILATELNLKQITVLEYLLNGKINLNKL